MLPLVHFEKFVYPQPTFVFQTTCRVHLHLKKTLEGTLWETKSLAFSLLLRVFEKNWFRLSSEEQCVQQFQEGAFVGKINTLKKMKTCKYKIITLLSNRQVFFQQREYKFGWKIFHPFFWISFLFPKNIKGLLGYTYNRGRRGMEVSAKKGIKTH